ncbi:50S ribosomal protein L18a [Candidatus Bathyarchaeota archaeon ex4484_135]|nr:MAG: 50S ribosomal protein L18a [Candidatus Bathyarchaeota archaeon ex4484_135]
MTLAEVRVRNFRVEGLIRKPNWKTKFKKEVRAIKPEDAVEKVLMEMGSKHRVKRCHIKILKVVEIAPEELEDPVLRKVALGEV